MSASKQHVLILGGGYVGLYTAWGLQKQLASTSMRITLVEPNAYMTYQPLLPEVAGGEIEPRNVTVQLRKALPRVDLFRGKLQDLDCEQKTATLLSVDGESVRMDYDHVVFALGAITRTFPTPGLEENAVGFKTVEECVYLRNRVLDSIALAASTTDPAERAKALSFVFIGGGYTGVEAIAELSDLAKIALRSYPGVSESDMHWVLLEALDRVAVEVGPQLSKWTLQHLRKRGIDVRLETTMKSCIDGQVVLSDGDSFAAGTIVWTAGMKPNPVLDATNVPRGPKGHVNANARLQVITDDGDVVDGAWAAGDNAQVPDLTAEKQPAYYPPNAQNAVRQAKLLAKNIVAAIRDDEVVEYRHKSLGTLASYGVGKGAAVVLGVRLRGLPAWIADRAYHGLAMPTYARKARIFAGWLINQFTPRDITPMTATEHPRRAFVSGMNAQGQVGSSDKASAGKSDDSST
ncbi:FAD-dependent oxidoreductase [Saxibacter everestensis]|uniref:FAD-dependent oxidoreductase n=1 Tax=Saxibacter everestensis TaxID=2909229 RepID=A0ABY8QSG7_9MICO|nr:FAD-dependent oxidoreductase [Brevibacteriaceae bacterium ZFBP1038]